MTTATKPETEPPGKKVALLDLAEQRRHFEELSRELGTDNGEKLNWVLGKIVPVKDA